jgi:hypothetical protein
MMQSILLAGFDSAGRVEQGEQEKDACASEWQDRDQRKCLCLGVLKAPAFGFRNSSTEFFRSFDP